MDIIEKSLDKLIMYKNNNKIHNASQIDLIANSIAEFGRLQPIVIDKNNIIIA
jgi:ParB-like chromosome segregation protein Spo0J